MNKKMTLKKTLFSVLSVSALAIALVMGSAAIARADDHENGDRIISERGNSQESDARALGSSLEIHITNGGKVLVRGAKVTAVSGSTITASTAWGSANMSWTVNTDSNTKIVRRAGGASSLSEITVGDFISFQGMLATGTASPMTVNATTVKDWSIQKKNGTFEGTVSSISGSSFVLASNNRGNITVTTSSSTEYKKNNGTATFNDIVVGWKVTASGLYNNLNSTLAADKVMIHVTINDEHQTTNREGTIKTAPGASLPTTFVMTSGGTDYTVRLATNTSIVTNNFLSSALSAITVNGHVRVYGTYNSDNTVDATIVRLGN